MADWIERLLPYVLPLVLAVLGAVFTSSALTPRRLRREIAEDTAIAATLRGAAKGLLAEDVARRAIHLSAWNRYPILTTVDLIRIGVIAFVLGAFGLGIWSTVADHPSRFSFEEHILLTVVYWLIAGPQWWALHNEIGLRRQQRRVFRAAHGSSNDGDHDDFRELAGTMASGLLGIAMLVLPTATFYAVLVDALGSPDGWLGLVVVGSAIGSVAIITLAARPPRKLVGMRQALRLQDEAARTAQEQKKQGKARRKRPQFNRFRFRSRD